VARNLPGHPLRVSPAGSAAVSAASSSGNRPVTLRVAGDVANRCGQDDRARVPERVLGRWGGSPRRAGALRPETEGNRVAVRRVGKQRGADHQRWSDADVVRHGRLTMQTARLHAARALAAGCPQPGEPPTGWAVCGRSAGTVCAVRRFVASLMQLGGTWRSVPGSPGLPRRESVRGQQHAREAVVVWRRPGWRAARPAR